MKYNKNSHENGLTTALVYDMCMVLINKGIDSDDFDKISLILSNISNINSDLVKRLISDLHGCLSKDTTTNKDIITSHYNKIKDVMFRLDEIEYIVIYRALVNMYKLLSMRY